MSDEIDERWRGPKIVAALFCTAMAVMFIGAYSGLLHH